MQRTFYLLYRGLTLLFVAGAVLQFFLAGLGVFGAASFGPHMTVGKLLALASLILLVLAAILALSGGLSRGWGWQRCYSCSWSCSGRWWKRSRRVRRP
jgi:hypothetical protein